MVSHAPTIVITGANRGIGLGLVREFLQLGWKVIGTYRSGAATQDLDVLQSDFAQNLLLVECDVTNELSVRKCSRRIGQWTESIDTLINNAGVLLDRGVDAPDTDINVLRKSIDVNVIGVMRVTQALTPLLRAAPRAKIVHVSSIMGSLGLTASGGAMAYRVSKAALNMLSLSLAHALRESGIISMAVHPGWVKTEMGGEGARVAVADSARGIVQLVRSATLETHSGKFFDFNGDELKW